MGSEETPEKEDGEEGESKPLIISDDEKQDMEEGDKIF